MSSRHSLHQRTDPLAHHRGISLSLQCSSSFLVSLGQPSRVRMKTLRDSFAKIAYLESTHSPPLSWWQHFHLISVTSMRSKFGEVLHFASEVFTYPTQVSQSLLFECRMPSPYPAWPAQQQFFSLAQPRSFWDPIPSIPWFWWAQGVSSTQLPPHSSKLKFPRSSFAARGITSSAQPPSCLQVPSPSVEEWLGIALTPLLFSPDQLLFASEPPAVAVVATAAEGVFVAAFEVPQASPQLSSTCPQLLATFFAHQFSFTLLMPQVVSFDRRGHLVFFVQREHPIFIAQQ